MYHLTLLIFLLKLTVQALSEECITPDQHEGDCVSLYFCPALTATIATQKPEAIEFIRRSNCGGTVVDPKVCCRRLPSNALPEKCATPDGNEGECIPLYSCLALVDKIATQESEAIEFVRRSNCGGTAANPKVCCRLPPKYKISSNSTTNNTKYLLTGNRVKTAPKTELLSDRRYCGFQHADDYFRQDNYTSLDEYPWLAFLVYVETETGKREETWVCSGALISKRYVLTLDICTMHKIVTLVGVRLGDHNVDSKSDCVTDSPLDECNLPYEEYGIESIIKYSGPNKIDGSNLALIRLNKTVEYSDYIRPICLPEPSTAAKVGNTLITSGWSRSIFRPRNKYLHALVDTNKSKTWTRITSNEECSRNIPRLNFSENHLCTSDVEGSDNWNWLGNFGGPLMFSVKSQWQVEGIVDRGDVFTQRHIKVANYIDWIKENVKP